MDIINNLTDIFNSTLGNDQNGNGISIGKVVGGTVILII